MSNRKITFSTLRAKDWVLGFVMCFLCIAIAKVLVAVLNISLPEIVPAAAGSALGTAAWFTILRRKADHAR
jgi:hypothetical protein